MSHRSPLVTLAGLTAAFAIMFGVNVASSAPADSYRGGSSPSPSATATAASPTTASPVSPTPSPSPTPRSTPSPSPSATKSTDQSQFPDRVVYAGRIRDGSAAIAVAVLGDRVAAYFCDGRTIETWLRGTVTKGRLKVRSRDGSRLTARLDGRRLRGTIKVGGGAQFTFVLREANKPAGLYRAKNSSTTIGWIVLPDGSQVGVQTRGDNSESAPTLDPDAPQVTVGGETLDATAVSGDTDL